MIFGSAAKQIRVSIEENLIHTDFALPYRSGIWTNDIIERLNCGIKRRTKVNQCLSGWTEYPVTICARLHHVAGGALVLHEHGLYLKKS